VSRPDRLALAILVALPLAVFGIPALMGHPVLLSDNLIQSYPLRVLVGSQIRHGHLPLFDPYISSGATLLGGWNAGAAYPFTLLFVILPGTAAWTLNLVLTWWVAGIGCFVFLRASRLAAAPSFLGALSFSFAGAMIAQEIHFGLVAGVSWVPVALLALLRLSEYSVARDVTAESRRAALRSRLGWTALLCVAGAMAILAGEPRAISDFAVIVGMYALWRALRLGRRAWPFLVCVAGGLLLAVALGAVQWMPGEAALSSSQRSVSTTYFFTSGSLPKNWLLLMLVPDLLGGSGSFGQPSFLATYNLSEVTSYIGLMPLVASFAMLGRLRWRRPAPEWLVWMVMALVGVLLALGGTIPLWHLTIHVPFFGGERLQSRNIVIADMGFAFLLAYWSDAWLDAARARRGSRRSSMPRTAVEAITVEKAPDGSSSSSGHLGSVYGRRSRILGSVPGLVALTTVVLGIAWGAGLLHWLGVDVRAAGKDGSLRLWFLPSGVLAVGALSLVLWGHRLELRWRARALLGFVVVDLGIFTMLALVPVAASLGGRSAGPAPSSEAGASPGLSVPAPSTTHSSSAFSGSGRFAVYDPNLLNGKGLYVIGAPDLNVVGGVPSVQGYGSIVDGSYASRTGSHLPTGLGQDILSPAAVGDGTLDQLETTVLFAPRDYFLVAESDAATPAPAAGERQVAPSGRATWYLGADLDVASFVVPDANVTSDARSGLRFGVVTPRGNTLWAPGVTLEGAHFSVAFSRPMAAIALVAQAGQARIGLGSPSITSGDGAKYVADGQLEAAVVPPRWAYRRQAGTFAVFADRLADSALSLRGSPGATVRAIAGPAFAPSAAEVSSPHGVEVVRSEAAIPGWTATWHPDSGPALTLLVHRVGLVQGVKVPAGHGVLTWTYDPPGWTAGWVFSACALTVLVVVLLWAQTIAFRRPRKRIMWEQAPAGRSTS